MYFLFSGEGSTDLGLCANDTDTCDGNNYLNGPMTVVVDQIVEEHHHYSFLESEYHGFVTKRALKQRRDDMKAAKKSLGLPGKKRAKETRYFFNNARVFAKVAIEKEAELNDDVVAVLFQDADKASAGRGEWSDKRRSMIDGFDEEGFTRGVPMIPGLTSEAWLLCSLRKYPLPGNEQQAEVANYTGMKASKALKVELEDRIGQHPSRELLCQLVAERKINIVHIDTPCFAAFRNRLETII